MCKELKLIIEVDGITHHFEETSVKDEKKTKDLAEAGFQVVRIKDEDVLNINGVYQYLENIIEGMEDFD